jgi:glycosyltransferase involved in cell wall biosynthesis
VSSQSLIVHTESSLGWGGQEIRILTEAQAMSRMGVKVVLVANPSSFIFARAHFYNITAYPARIRSKGIISIISLSARLSDLKPTLVCTHSSTDHWAAALSRIFFLRRQFRIIRTRHVSTAVSRNFLTRWLYNAGCEAVITTGESIRRDLTSDGFLPSWKVFSVPTGIDLNLFKPVNKRDSREKLGIDNTRVVFGNVATLRSWKGHSFLLEAFSQLRYANSLLMIVGAGPQSNNLKKIAVELRIDDKVIFYGHQDDVTQFFDAMDVFVFPSYANEGVPQAILQAIAYRLPIITTKVGSIEEAGHDYPLVQFIPEKNAQLLRNAMAEFINSQRPKSLQSFNVSPVLQNKLQTISLPSMIDKLVQIYLSPTKH